jgi:hypothetical protein
MTSIRVGLGILVLLGIMILLLTAAAPAAAQTGEPRLGRLPDGVRGQVDSILGAARDGGLPTEPLIDRALEGAVKGAPPNSIVAAVARLRAELATARGAFGEGASAAELTAGASALRAGATAADLARLRSRRPDQAVTVAAAVLADLVSSGVPAEAAVGAVIALAAAADDADYVAFRRNVQRDIALGASPAAALGVRLRSATEMADAPSTGGTTGQGAGRRKQKP